MKSSQSPNENRPRWLDDTAKSYPMKIIQPCLQRVCDLQSQISINVVILLIDISTVDLRGSRAVKGVEHLGAQDGNFFFVDHIEHEASGIEAETQFSLGVPVRNFRLDERLRSPQVLEHGVSVHFGDGSQVHVDFEDLLYQKGWGEQTLVHGLIHSRELLQVGYVVFVIQDVP